MSEAPRVRSMNVVESVGRLVLGPAGNKERTLETRKPAVKAVKRVEKPSLDVEAKEKKVVSSPRSVARSPHCDKMQSMMKRRESRGLLNLSANGSFSSDVSTDSAHSRASSSGTMTRSRSSGGMIKKKQCGLKMEKDEKDDVDGVSVEKFEKKKSGLVSSNEGLETKKRCAWITPNTDPCYAAFHDEEWGVPIHDDKKLFELISLSSILAELTWPAILNKRNVFREVFLDFDPIAVSRLNEKKIVAPGSLGSSLLSELKLRAIIENARQICKIIEKFGSFNNYIWNFVSHKPVVSQFRHPRQVLVKTSKAEVISKELVKRGFRGVGPTVIYSFMQVAGLTNDHLISCFRFQECIAIAEGVLKNDKSNPKVEQKKVEDLTDLQLAGAVSNL